MKNILEGKFGTKLNYKGSDYTNEIIDLINELSLKLKDYEEKNVDTILLERNKFEAILMGILNGVVDCDNNDCVVLTNASAEKILSASQDVLLNIPIHQYTDSNGFCPFKENATYHVHRICKTTVSETKPRNTRRFYTNATERESFFFFYASNTE